VSIVTHKMRAREAAAYLRLAPSTLAKFRCQGGGPPFFKAGGRAVIYDRAQIDDWLASRLCKSTADHNPNVGK
jgi:predicted DNA-binding transcriptional regulator AlpA